MVENKQKGVVKTCDDDPDDLVVQDFLVNAFETDEEGKIEYIIYFDDTIRKAPFYREVFNVIRIATEDDIVRLVFNSGGGRVDTFIQIYHYLLNCPAHIICEVHSAYSAAALLSLCCDEFVYFIHTDMMFHSTLYGDEGFVSEIKNRSDFEKERVSDIYMDVCGKFFTPTEIKSIVNNNQTKFLNSKEVGKRLEKWIPLKNRSKKK